MEELFRVCNTCKEEKPVGKFAIMYKDGQASRWRRRRCNSCEVKRTKAYRNKRDKARPKNPGFKWATATAEQKFARVKEHFERIAIKNSDGCWGWKNKVWKNGYTRILYDGKFTSGHRVSWMIHNGAIPDGMCVLHACDCKICTNPAHLFLGTNADNSADMVKKGRSSHQCGEDRYNAVLNKKKVVEIKRLLSLGVTAPRIARDFKVSNTTIHKIKHGKSWKHVVIPGVSPK